jgi:hypothetical protein
MIMRAASRHLLLAEFLLGMFLVAWGTAKGVDTKGMGLIAEETGWILPCIVGGLQVIASTIEWFSPSRISFSLINPPEPQGRWAHAWWYVSIRWRSRAPWITKQLRRSVTTRFACAGFAAVLWAYDLKEFFFEPTVLSGVVLTLIAPVCVGMNLYSVYANLKVKVALDPDVSTTGLHFDR